MKKLLKCLRCFDTIQSLCRTISLNFGGPRFAEFQKGVKIVGLYIKLKTCSRLQKRSFRIIILTEIKFISLKTPT